MPGRDYKKCANCAIISDKTIKFPPPCGHVICSGCFPNDPIQRAETLDSSKCPVCQELFLFPNERPKSSFRPLRQFGYVRDCLLAKNPPQCRSCADGQTKATAQCENCLVYLCRECADSHIKQGTLNDKHYVFTFEEIRLGRSKRSSRCETECPCDERLKFTTFCMNCEIAFCDVCALEHPHPVVDLEAGLKSCIKQYTDKVEACAMEATDTQERLTAEGKRVTAEYETKKRQIEEHANLLVALILQKRDQAVARITEEFEVHQFYQKPLVDSFTMSEAQISAIKTSIALIDSVVDEDNADDTHLRNVLAFLKANTKAIDDTPRAIQSLNRGMHSLTPYGVIINHDTEVMIQQAHIFSALPKETLKCALDADTHIGSDNFPSHVASMDVYSCKDGSSNIFVADQENFKVKVFILREEENELKLKLHKSNIAADKEPAVVFQDGIRDERDQLNDAICIHYTENNDPGSYHKLDDVLQPFDNMKQLRMTLNVKSIGPGYSIDVRWKKVPHILNLSEQVAREGLQQGYFLLEMFNTLRIELRFSRCVEGALFAASGFHRPSNRSILILGSRERPMKVLRFDHDTPGGVAIDSKCNIYYADPCNGRILTLTKSGKVVHSFVGFKDPIDVCVLDTMKQDQGASEQADSLQSEDDLCADRAEYMVVVERQGGLKAFDLRQIADRGCFP